MDARHSLEMSLTRAEFLRLLPAAVGPFEIHGETIRPSDGNRDWAIRLTPVPDRHLGRVSVPRLLVAIAIDGCSEAEGEAFMDQFHRAFLRAGG
jgi:hypothetical protein